MSFCLRFVLAVSWTRGARQRPARFCRIWCATLASVYHQSTELAAKTLGVERVSIWLFVQNRAAIRCFDLYEQRRGEHSEGAVLARANYPDYFAALEDHRVIPADDARSHPATRGFCATYLEPLDIRVAPIRMDNRREDAAAPNAFSSVSSSPT